MSTIFPADLQPNTEGVEPTSEKSDMQVATIMALVLTVLDDLLSTSFLEANNQADFRESSGLSDLQVRFIPQAQTQELVQIHHWMQQALVTCFVELEKKFSSSTINNFFNNSAQQNTAFSQAKSLESKALQDPLPTSLQKISISINAANVRLHNGPQQSHPAFTAFSAKPTPKTDEKGSFCLLLDAPLCKAFSYLGKLWFTSTNPCFSQQKLIDSFCKILRLSGFGALIDSFIQDPKDFSTFSRLLLEEISSFATNRNSSTNGSEKNMEGLVFLDSVPAKQFAKTFMRLLANISTEQPNNIPFVDQEAKMIQALPLYPDIDFTRKTKWKKSLERQEEEGEDSPEEQECSQDPEKEE